MEVQPKRGLLERVHAMLLYPGRPPRDGFERAARVVLVVFLAGGGLCHALDTLADSPRFDQVGAFVPLALMALASGVVMSWRSGDVMDELAGTDLGARRHHRQRDSVHRVVLALALRFSNAPRPEDLVLFAFMPVTAAWFWLRLRARHGGPVRPTRIATLRMIAGLVALAQLAVNRPTVELKGAWANRGEFSDENRPALAPAGTGVAGIAFTTCGGATLALGTPGMLYVVDCVAPWCGPCREEVPHLVELARDPAYRDRFRLVLVNSAEPEVPPKAHRLFKWDDIVVDRANWGDRIGVSAYPTKVLIRDGKIAATFVGGSEDAWESYPRVIDEFAAATPRAPPVAGARGAVAGSAAAVPTAAPGEAGAR